MAENYCFQIISGKHYFFYVLVNLLCNQYSLNLHSSLNRKRIKYIKWISSLPQLLLSVRKVHLCEIFGRWWALMPFYLSLYFPQCRQHIVDTARAYLNDDSQRRRSIEIPKNPRPRWKKYGAQSRWTPVQSASLLSANKKDSEKCGNDALSSHCLRQLYPITPDPLLPFLPFVSTDRSTLR